MKATHVILLAFCNQLVAWQWCLFSALMLFVAWQKCVWPVTILCHSDDRCVVICVGSSWTCVPTVITVLILSLSVLLHLRHKRTDGRRDTSLRPSVRTFVRSFVYLSLCLFCLSGAPIVWRNELPCFLEIEGGDILNQSYSRSNNKYAKLGQLIIRKIIKIITIRCNILRLKCTKLYSRRLSLRSSVRLCLDTVDESQQRRHGVTAAIVVDVVGALRPCASFCPSVRSFFCVKLHLRDGRTKKCLFVRPSLRWSLTQNPEFVLMLTLIGCLDKRPQMCVHCMPVMMVTL